MIQRNCVVFTVSAILFLIVFSIPSLIASHENSNKQSFKSSIPQSTIQNLSSTSTRDPKLDSAAFAQKTKKLQIPFLANNGQVDEQVKFYANTFGGTVFVTKDGEIVYSLPNNSSDVETQCLASSMHSPNGIHNAKYKIQNTRNMSNITDRVPCILHHESNIPYCTNCLLACLAKHTGRDTQGVAIKETLVGGRVQEITGNEKAVTKVSYFKGNDKSQWKTNISAYDVVSLGEVYDGIELKLKAYGNNVEKLFCVKPDANSEQIQVKLSGAKGLRVNNEGQLVAETKLGAVKFTKPVAYQEINGKRVDVSVGYRVGSSEAENKSSKHKTCNSRRMSTNPQSETRNLSPTSIGDPKLEYGFTVASYDRTKELIIDPLLASTFLGGSNEDYGYSLALDTSGNVYVTGYTKSTDFPTTSGAYDISYNGNFDVFVSKLNGALTSLLASAYLGGSSTDMMFSIGESIAIALDSDGNVYVAGGTWSSDFPTTSDAYDTSSNGSDDVFVSKLNGALTSLFASTYLGGSGQDWCNSIAIDSGGNVYVTGYTSGDFPTTPGAYDTSHNGHFDVFVSKFNGTLTSLLASTYLGGDGYYDVAKSIAIDSGGNVYVSGWTASSDFPTTPGAYDTDRYQSGFYDAFVSKFNGTLTSLLASTYLGGSGDYDIAKSIVIDSGGNVYVVGNTGSSDFPTTLGAYDTSYNGGYYDAFVSKFNGALTNLLASTFLGGSGDDASSFSVNAAIAIDSGGNIYVTDSTYSRDFPTTGGAYDTSYNGSGDVFVSKLDGGLTSLLASTYLGGSSTDEGFSLTLDTSGNVYVAGYTGSSDFPTTGGAYDTSYNSSDGDVFVSKLDGNLSASAATTPTPSPTPSPVPTPSPTTSPEEENLLEKYAPILYMHGQERFHPTNVKVILDNSELYEKTCKKEKNGECKKYKGEQVRETKNKELTTDLLMDEYNDDIYYLQLKKKAKKKLEKEWKERQTVYSRQTTDTDEYGKEKIILQYWFFYVYNDWQNNHEGDWEMIQIILDSKKQPERITFGFHHGGQKFEWDEKGEDGEYKVRKSKNDNHPFVYVTLGGHGCWNNAGENKWYQIDTTYDLGGCLDCTDNTSDSGDILFPSTMPETEISNEQTNNKKYSYTIEDITDLKNENSDWIYWKGYWGEQSKKKLNGKDDAGKSGPPSPPYIDYIYTLLEKQGRWYEPIQWADDPLPSVYTVCSSANSKIIVNNSLSLFSNSCNPISDYDPFNYDECTSGCSTIMKIISVENIVFNIFSLDGEEVTLKINRYNRDTKEVCEVEFDWLEIPRNGKATLRFSPDENPNLEMEIDHDLNGIFDYRVSPNYVEFR